MNNNLIRILILFFLMLNFFPTDTQAAGTSSITITVTIAEAEIIEATIEFQPSTIHNRLRYIMCYIELPQDDKAEDINVNTVKLTEVNGETINPPLTTEGRQRIGDFDRDGISDLRVVFNIQTIIPLLKAGDNTLTVSGNLIDGKTFKGTGTIRFIKRR